MKLNFEYKIIKSKKRKKTYQIKINKENEVILSIPKDIKKEQALRILKNHENWINEKLLELKNLKKEKKYENGDYILFLGQKYIITYEENNKTNFYFSGDKIILNKALKNCIKENLKEFYKIKAKNFLLDRLNYISAFTKIKYNKFRISSAMKTWGSCNTINTIGLSWRLMMMPIEVIDSIIIHELAHVIEKNHSKKFWEIVYKFCPNYDEMKKWIKNNILDLTL